MVYQWKQGFRHSVSAQVAGEVCESLEQNGQLTAKRLVEVSRPVDAPLHPEFEWDDSVAAEQWREQQARCIINTIVIIHPPKKAQEMTLAVEKTGTVRRFFNIESKTGNYESIDRILADDNKRMKLLNQALGDLENFRRKYAELTELEPVFEAVDAVQAEEGVNRWAF